MRAAVLEQDRVESVQHIGLDWMQVSHAGKSVMFTEGGGGGRRWDVFYYESP